MTPLWFVIGILVPILFALAAQWLGVPEKLAWHAELLALIACLGWCLVFLQQAYEARHSGAYVAGLAAAGGALWLDRRRARQA